MHKVASEAGEIRNVISLEWTAWTGDRDAATTPVCHNTLPQRVYPNPSPSEITTRRGKQDGGGPTGGWATGEEVRGAEGCEGRRVRRRRSKQGRKGRKDWIHTAIMPLVFIAHVTAVIVPITDPG